MERHELVQELGGEAHETSSQTGRRSKEGWVSRTSVEVLPLSPGSGVPSDAAGSGACPGLCLLPGITRSKFTDPGRRICLASRGQGPTFSLPGLGVTKHLVSQAPVAGGEDLLPPRLMKRRVLKHQKGLRLGTDFFKALKRAKSRGGPEHELGLSTGEKGSALGPAG